LNREALQHPQQRQQYDSNSRYQRPLVSSNNNWWKKNK
jgi:hypothetical protein